MAIFQPTPSLQQPIIYTRHSVCIHVRTDHFMHLSQQAFALKTIQLGIIDELLSLHLSQTRLPRVVLLKGKEVPDVTDMLPADAKEYALTLIKPS